MYVIFINKPFQNLNELIIRMFLHGNDWLPKLAFRRQGFKFGLVTAGQNGGGRRNCGIKPPSIQEEHSNSNNSHHHRHLLRLHHPQGSSMAILRLQLLLSIPQYTRFIPVIRTIMGKHTYLTELPPKPSTCHDNLGPNADTGAVKHFSKPVG